MALMNVIFVMSLMIPHRTLRILMMFDICDSHVTWANGNGDFHDLYGVHMAFMATMYLIPHVR